MGMRFRNRRRRVRRGRKLLFEWHESYELALLGVRSHGADKTYLDSFCRYERLLVMKELRILSCAFGRLAPLDRESAQKGDAGIFEGKGRIRKGSMISAFIRKV